MVDFKKRKCTIIMYLCNWMIQGVKKCVKDVRINKICENRVNFRKLTGKKNTFRVKKVFTASKTL